MPTTTGDPYEILHKEECCRCGDTTTQLVHVVADDPYWWCDACLEAVASKMYL